MKWANAQDAATDFEASPLAGEYQNWTADVRLQDDPGAALARVRAEQEHIVNSGGILSEEPLVYRIPVDAALEIVAEHGFPDFKPAAAGE